MNKIACFCVAICLLTSKLASADTRELGVLLVIDTNAGKRGGDARIHRQFAEANLKMWRTVIDGVYNSGTAFKGRLTLNVLKDNEVSPTNIRRYYNQRGFNPNRALLLYYSGHGGFDAQKGQFFATSGGDISRSEVAQLMKNRGAPGVFVLSDCCSNYCGMAPGAGQETTNDFGQTVLRTPNAHAFYNLFYQTQGQIEMTAAQRGQVAFLGLFTNALTEVLYQPNHLIRLNGANGSVTWHDYHTRVYHRTATNFQYVRANSARNDYIRQVSSQLPEFGMRALHQRTFSTAVRPPQRFEPAIQPPKTRSRDRIEITGE